MRRSGVIAIKLGMTSLYKNNIRIPVTLLQIKDCQVVGKRTIDKDNYNALILGADNFTKSENKYSKSRLSIFKQNNLPIKRILKEFAVSSENSTLEIGHVFRSDYFSVGHYVDVSGTSIGKGFAGAMKRHNFRGLEASHGVSVSHRSHGSTGQRQDPGKVFKGKKMAGHMGNRKVTVQNLQIIALDKEQNLIAIKGAVPGHKNSYVCITDAVKKSFISG